MIPQPVKRFLNGKKNKSSNDKRKGNQNGESVYHLLMNQREGRDGGDVFN